MNRALLALVLVASALAACHRRSQPSPISDARLAEMLREDDVAGVRGALGDEALRTRIIDADEQRGTLLTMAALFGAPRVSSMLLSVGAHVDGEPGVSNRERTEGAWGRTPLFQAARHGRLEIARQLLSAGADPRRIDHAGFAPIHAAAAFGFLPIVRLLLDEAHLRVDEASTRGDTPLKLAVMRRQDDVAEFLLTRHADPNLVDRRGDSALHEAVRNNDRRMAMLLLAHGAKGIADAEGRTATDDARDEAPDLLPILAVR